MEQLQIDELPNDTADRDVALDEAAQGTSGTAENTAVGTGEVNAIGYAAGFVVRDDRPFRGIDRGIERRDAASLGAQSRARPTWLAEARDDRFDDALGLRAGEGPVQARVHCQCWFAHPTFRRRALRPTRGRPKPGLGAICPTSRRRQTVEQAALMDGTQRAHGLCMIKFMVAALAFTMFTGIASADRRDNRRRNDRHDNGPVVRDHRNNQPSRVNRPAQRPDRRLIRVARSTSTTAATCSGVESAACTRVR